MNDDMERRQTKPGDVECLRPSEQRIEVSTLVHAMDLARRSWDHDDIVEFGGYAHGVAYNLHKAGVVITINGTVVDPGALSQQQWRQLLRENNITIPAWDSWVLDETLSPGQRPARRVPLSRKGTHANGG